MPSVVIRTHDRSLSRRFTRTGAIAPKLSVRGKRIELAIPCATSAPLPLFAAVEAGDRAGVVAGVAVVRAGDGEGLMRPWEVGVTLGDGLGFGDVLGEAIGEGVGFGLALAVGEGLGEGLALAFGEGLGEALGLGLGLTVGEGLGLGLGEGLALAFGEGLGLVAGLA